MATIIIIIILLGVLAAVYGLIVIVNAPIKAKHPANEALVESPYLPPEIISYESAYNPEHQINQKNTAADFRPMLRFVYWLPLFGLVVGYLTLMGRADFDVLALYDKNPEIRQANSINYISALGMFALIAVSCFIGGSFLGALFGIPQPVPGKNGKKTLENKILLYNDNLVEISNWLTKIIVGLCLINFGKLYSSLEVLSHKLAPDLSNNLSFGQHFATGIVIYFLISGFLGGYFLTRIYWPKLFIDTTYKENIVSQNIELPLSMSMHDHSDEANGRRFTAEVTKGNISGTFNIKLRVVGLDLNKPLGNSVTFHFDNSFQLRDQVVPVQNNQAILSVIAYSTFTVEAVADNGTTRISLPVALKTEIPHK